jgi:hypothetical protein
MDRKINSTLSQRNSHQKILPMNISLKRIPKMSENNLVEHCYLMDVPIVKKNTNIAIATQTKLTGQSKRIPDKHFSF